MSIDTISTEDIDLRQEEQKFPEFEDDDEFVNHIISNKPAELLVNVPMWNVQVLCRALGADARFNLQLASINIEKGTYDYRPHFYMIVMEGCLNPKTGHKAFSEKHRDAIMKQQDGLAVETLALVILQLSHLLNAGIEGTAKN